MYSIYLGLFNAPFGLPLFFGGVAGGTGVLDFDLSFGVDTGVISK